MVPNVQKQLKAFNFEEADLENMDILKYHEQNEAHTLHQKTIQISGFLQLNANSI